MMKQIVSIKEINDLFSSEISQKDKFDIEFYCIRYFEYEILNRLKDSFKIKGSFEKPIFDIEDGKLSDLISKAIDILSNKLNETVTLFLDNFISESFSDEIKIVALDGFDEKFHFDLYRVEENHYLVDDISGAFNKSWADRLISIIDYCENKPYFALVIQGTFEAKFILFYNSEVAEKVK